MIAYIKGELAYKGNNYAVIEANGIGYKLYMSGTELLELPKSGEIVQVYTYMYIREDILDLYGFLSQETMSIFELLLSVSGVGPKAALAALSTMSPAGFIQAISTGDHKMISTTPGIGPKLSQRIVLELKDKLGGLSIGGATQANTTTNSGRNMFDEALGALMSFGYTRFDAGNAISKSGGDNLEDVIKGALKQLMK